MMVFLYHHCKTYCEPHTLYNFSPPIPFSKRGMCLNLLQGGRSESCTINCLNCQISVLAGFLVNPGKRKLSDEVVGTATKSRFKVDDTNGDLRDDDLITTETEYSKSEYDDEANHFDSVCAICDNGGGLLW